MACGVFPGDLEEPLVAVDPAQAGVPAAVHLRQQPRLQANAAGLRAHGHVTLQRLRDLPWEKLHGVNEVFNQITFQLLINRRRLMRETTPMGAT